MEACSIIQYVIEVGRLSQGCEYRISASRPWPSFGGETLDCTTDKDCAFSSALTRRTTRVGPQAANLYDSLPFVSPMEGGGTLALLSLL